MRRKALFFILNNNNKKYAKLPWIFPVYIQAIEFVLSQELYGFIHELIHTENISSQLLEWGGPESPSSDG